MSRGRASTNQTFFAGEAKNSRNDIAHEHTIICRQLFAFLSVCHQSCHRKSNQLQYKPKKIYELIFLNLQLVHDWTKVPGRFLVIKEEAVASLTCEAFSYPPSVVTWARSLASLPKGRSRVVNGTLSIRDFSIADMGIYVCNASNKLGSVTAFITLGIQRKIKG